MTNIVTKRLDSLNRYVTGAAIKDKNGGIVRDAQPNILVRTRDHGQFMFRRAEVSTQIGNDVNNNNDIVPTTAISISRTSAGGPHQFDRNKLEPEAIAPSTEARFDQEAKLQEGRLSDSKSTYVRTTDASSSKGLAKNRKGRMAAGLKALKGVAKLTARVVTTGRLRAAQAEAKMAPKLVLPARDTDQFRARLEKNFAGSREAEIDTLNTRLDILKNLMPVRGYLFALDMTEALSKACAGDAGLAAKVLEEMERCRVHGDADSVEGHNPTRSATRFMSCLRPWLVNDAPGRDKAINDDHVMNALGRTAALLSNIKHSNTGFQALCLATGISSARSIREELSSQTAAGAVGPHRLDPGDPEVGKHLVLIACQGLQYGKDPNSLGSRVIGHARKIITMLENEYFMEDIRGGPIAPPAGVAAVAPGAEFVIINQPPEAAPAEVIAPPSPDHTKELRDEHHQEMQGLHFRIDRLVGRDEKAQQAILEHNAALENNIGAIPPGIGEDAFVDLLCWLNGMRTDKDIERRGLMHKRLAEEYQICDEYADRPELKYVGPLKHLIAGSSALYAMFSLGDKGASKKHLDEVRDEYYKTVTTFLNLVDEHFTRRPTQLRRDGEQAPQLSAGRLHHLLLRTAHDTQVKQQKYEAEAAKREKAARRSSQAQTTEPQHQPQSIELQQQDFQAIQEASNTSITDEAELVRAYCAIYAPELQSRPPETVNDLIRQINLLKLPADHFALARFIGNLRIDSEAQYVAQVDERRYESQYLLQDLHGLLHKLGTLAHGKATRGPGHIEDVCRARVFDALYKQDNSITSKHGVGAGMPKVSGSFPLAPVAGAPKVTVSANFMISHERHANNIGENQGGQRLLASGNTVTGGMAIGLSAGEDVGFAEASGTLERGYSRTRTELVGCMTTFMRHAKNRIVDGVVRANALAQEVYGNLGYFGAFRVREAEDEAWHAEFARNPDGLTPEEIRMSYPEHLRPSQEALDSAIRKQTVIPRDAANLTSEQARAMSDPQTIKALTGSQLTAEERRVLRDPHNVRKLADVDGRGYFKCYFKKFGYYDNAIALTESRRDVVTDKKYTAVIGKVKSTLNESLKAEAQLSVTQTHAKETNDLYDVQGSLDFKHFSTITTESTTVGASLQLIGSETLDSDGDGSEPPTTKRVDVDAIGASYTRRIGYSLKRRVIKMLRNQGETTAFHTYSGFNCSSFAQFKMIVMADPEAWRNLLCDASNGTLEEQLKYLEKIDPHQTKQYVIRYRLHASAGIKLDQIKSEIQHTENGIRQILREIEAASGNPTRRKELKAQLADLEHTLSALYGEELDLLGNGKSWEPFGLGTLEVSSKTAKSSATASVAAGNLKVIAGAVDEMSRVIATETAWLKANSKASDARFREAKKHDYLTSESDLISQLEDPAKANSLKTVIDGLGGLIRSGVPSSKLMQVADRAIDIIRENQADASPAERATLCRHLLALGKEDSFNELVTEGIVTLKDIFEQAVRSKRITAVEWLLLEHQGKQKDFAAQQENTKAERWNVRAALQAMPDQDRMALLYGVMVRDTSAGVRNHTNAPHSGLVSDAHYDPTVWEGRTTALNEAGQAVVGKPRGIAPPGPQDDQELHADIEAAFYGIMVDGLVDHGHVRGAEILNLLQNRLDPRTLDLAMTQAARHPHEDGYSVSMVLSKLREISSRLSDAERDNLWEHVTDHYGWVTSRYLRYALDHPSSVQDFAPEMIHKEITRQYRGDRSAMYRGDPAGTITMLEMGHLRIGDLLKLPHTRGLTDDDQAHLVHALLVRHPDLLSDKHVALLVTRRPDLLSDDDLGLLFARALDAGSRRLLNALADWMCVRLGTPDHPEIAWLHSVLEASSTHTSEDALRYVISLLHARGRKGVVKMLFKACVRPQPPAYAATLLPVLCRHPAMAHMKFRGLPVREWGRQNLPDHLAPDQPVLAVRPPAQVQNEFHAPDQRPGADGIPVAEEHLA